MPNPPMTNQRPDHLSSDLPDKSVHFELVKKAIPSWLSDASMSRVTALKTDNLTIPDWQRGAAQKQHRRLKNGIKLSWTAQNNVDKALSDLQDVYTFARPLLQKALKERFGVEDDVEDTWLRLYAPVKTPWWVHDFSDGTTSRTVSLLDAALHNFSRDEAFSQDSEFITRPDVRGHFGVKPLKHKLSIDQFKSLCRELDIGAQYEQHLNKVLLSTNKVARNVLRHKVMISQKSTLNVAAQMALMKQDIDSKVYGVVLDMLDDRARVEWNGRAVGYYNLTLMDVSLTGIVLIAAIDISTATTPVPMIAYVPHDPEHPLKQYPSALDFMAELTRQLRGEAPATSYQKFFSQFVSHQQRGHFFARLNDRLSTVKWQPTPPGSNLPSWRETPVDNPDLQFSLSSVRDDRQTRFNGDLWGYFYRQKLNKILNDAREIAISTQYADRMARWAWWDNLEKILSDILNVALLVVTPFVPFLDGLMLAYTVYQLTDEVFEGIVDWAEGRFAEAAEQAIDVLESVVQLGAFAAGAQIGHAARLKLSPFVEGMKPVTLPDGQTRLWHPDLTPYQQPDLAVKKDSIPDAQGLHQHQGKQVLPLENQHFEVQKDPTSKQYRIKHPQRPNAYAPALKHNGHGAWVSETENPRGWQTSKLMRRLGHSVDAYTDRQLEQIRRVSGTDEAVLRRMYVENAAPPPLLTDTLQRLDGHTAITTAPLEADIRLLQRDFPDLPVSVAEKIMAQASTSERQRMTTQDRLPLRLKTMARELQLETQTVRASQGVYKESLANVDTERLVLGSLRLYTDLFGDLRIEIRQGTIDGALRCSAGPEDATLVRVLLTDDSGKYQLRDAENSILLDAGNLYESILHALPGEQQDSLGYKPGDGERFKQWVLAKTAAPIDRRTILAEPPIRPVAEHETLLLVRGAGLSLSGVTLHERIQDLHPHFSENEVNTFANALIAQGEPLRAMDAQENDFEELRGILHRWEYQQPQYWGPGAHGFRDGGGQHIAERLIDCFERKNIDLGSRTDPSSYALDLSRELLPLDLETWWSKRPELKKFLDKITVLKLDNTRISSGSNGLLKDFPNLRELSVKGCDLTHLPKGIGTMHRLERLRLSDNKIVLDAPAVEQLRNLTYLEILRLDANPLGRLPDIGRMPRLKVVGLRDTGIATWPLGTFDKIRPRGFFLDMRDNPITLIPEVVPGSSDAWVVARTRLDVGNLSEINQVLYQQVRKTVALPPEPAVRLPGEVVYPTDDSIWTNVPGVGIDRAAFWEDLKLEPNAGPFMAVISSAQQFADYRAGGQARTQLLQRLWRMLDAVYMDTRLREKLFTMTIAPVDCADAGAQLFNHMGIQVIASEAYLYSTDPVQLEQKLVTLAEGAARLEQVNDIARSDIDSRGGSPDDVEVYLAYQTGLAQRLNLPWQSEGMLYRPVSGVTDAMIDQAYDTALSLGEGDGLVNRMLEQEFWETYLRKTYPVQFEENTRLYLSKFEQLETLRTTQHEWVNSAQLTEPQRMDLRNRLNDLMNDLPVPSTVVFADEPISDATFDRLLVDLGYEESELSRRFTRAALRRAKQ